MFSKNILVALAVCAWSLTAMAQAPSVKEAAQKATEELAAMYNLSESQITQMLVIQERRFNNLAEIEPLKTSDELLYRQKLRTIRLGMEASMERMFTPEQRLILNEQRAERRRQDAARLKELQANAASKQELMNFMLELEAERY